MELVIAVAARQRGEAPVRAMQHAIADAAILDAIHLVVDIALPEQDRTNDVAVTRLDEIANGQGPLAYLTTLKLQLICQINHDRLKRVLSRDL